MGGGITGSGLARLASRNGFRVALLEQADLGSGASSASSHMLHGGLRYLEQARLSLVRESLAQRAQVSAMAPWLVEPRRFVVPLYRGDRLGPWRLRAGLALYDLLAGGRGLTPHAMVRRGEALALEPGLASLGLRGAGIYSDTVMDDARLTVAVARDAAAHGAEIHTYTEVLGARPLPGGGYEVTARDTLSDAPPMALAARAIVNATGAWSDAVRLRLLRALAAGRPDPAPALRPSRGIHLVYPAITRGHALLLTARRDGRVFFVVPFGGHSLVGTTEIEVPSPPRPEMWRASAEEVRYLREELRRALPDAADLPPLAVISGLRPLLASEGAVGEASREHRVLEEHGLFTIAGGKFTTFRVMARDTLRRVVARLGLHGRALDDPAAPLPAPLAPGAGLDPLTDFAIDREHARRVADVVRRRTRLWLEPDRGRAAASRIARRMAERLGWSAARQDQEFQAYDAELWEEEALLAQAADPSRGAA